MTKTKRGPACPKCSSRSSDVGRTKPRGTEVRRQRTCIDCGARWITREVGLWESVTGGSLLSDVMRMPTSTRTDAFILAGEEQSPPREIKTDGDQSDHVES